MKGEFEREPSANLTMFRLSYDFKDALRAEYQFTVGVPYVASGGGWSSYTRSGTAYSESLPAALHEHREAPRLLQQYWLKTPHFVTTPRWTAADRSPRMRALLRRIFDAEGGS